MIRGLARQAVMSLPVAGSGFIGPPMEYRADIAAWFSNFFENALVSLVNRRIDILIAAAAEEVNPTCSARLFRVMPSGRRRWRRG